MNIIFTSFEEPIDVVALERAFKGMQLNTCISVNNRKERMPRLDAATHLWMDERKMREGRFEDTNWNAIAALDEELIEQMRPCESVFLSMIGKYARSGKKGIFSDLPFDERRRRYYAQLRFWSDVLNKYDIDAVLMYHVPHKCYDWVLYHLCKLKGIPLLYLEHLVSVDTIFTATDWEESAPALRKASESVYKEYADTTKPVPLSDEYEWYFQNFRKERPMILYTPKKDGLVQKHFFLKWRKKAIQMLKENPKAFLRAVTSPQFWSRKLQQHETIRFYEEHARMPDLSKRYIYFPLQFQPEATTLPLGGAFADQERTIQLIASHLPKDVAIYVKEHPAQGERWRSIPFYKALLAIPQVTLVARDANTFDLSDNAVAIATATGTAGFEGFMRQKPVLMFGHIYYQYAPGIHLIRTSDDCKKAIDAILSGKAKPTERDVRLFMKAIESCATPYPGPHQSANTLSQEEKTDRWAALMKKDIVALMGARS